MMLELIQYSTLLGHSSRTFLPIFIFSLFSLGDAII